ncbi:MAG: hypothetical protein OSB09_08285, partial [Planctomycetota bacterium]|nr:hypothetical protein [Planctomycetota bacterium]
RSDLQRSDLRLPDEPPRLWRSSPGAMVGMQQACQRRRETRDAAAVIVEDPLRMTDPPSDTGRPLSCSGPTLKGSMLR